MKVKEIKRQAQREDGQLLILPSNMEEAGALSSPTPSLSEGKDTTNSENYQEKIEYNNIISLHYTFSLYQGAH